MATMDPLPLPRGWTKTTRCSVPHAISLAFTALTRAWGVRDPAERIRVEVERPVSWAKLFLSRDLRSCPRYGSPVQVRLPLPTLRDNFAPQQGQVTSH